MHYLRDEVIVLRKIPYREFDRRYIMYGRQNGLLIAVARGAMKPGAKQAGQLEPLTMAQVMIAKGRNFDHLAVASHSRPKQSLSKLGALTAGGALADLYLKLIRPGVADERLFILWEEYLECLSGLPDEPTSLRAELLFAAASLRLMDALGYGPALRNCSLCHQPPGPTDTWYAPGINGLVCADCLSRYTEAVMPARAHSLSLMRFMREASLADVSRVGMTVEVAVNTIKIIQEVWQHAPLDKRPHGLETIAKFMAV